MTVKGALVFTKDGCFRAQDIYVENERFAEASSDENAIDAAGCLLIPGLIDIHFHGCAGYDFCDASYEALDKIGEYELQNGITSICPAAMTLPEEMLADICKTAVSYCSAWKAGSASRLCGINLEGPFISEEKKGAHNPAYIKAPDAKVFKHIFDASKGLVKLVTIAPETHNAIEFIKSLAPAVKIAVGHTACDYETANAAFLAGAGHMTHLFNAMPPLLHRSPGPVAAGAENPRVTAELICDNVHVAPAAARAAFSLFGDDRLVLISDSIRAVGMPDGKYMLGGLELFVKSSRAVLADGVIAGSTANLMDCVRIAVKQMKLPLESVIKAATINPARVIGEDSGYGSIETGKYADFLLLEKETLGIKKVFQHGAEVNLVHHNAHAVQR